MRTPDEGRREEARRLAAQDPAPSAREIADRLGVNIRTVQRWLGPTGARRGRRSPLNDRDFAEGYVRQAVQMWAAENIVDGAEALRQDTLDAVTADALAEWDERMADPERALPDGSHNPRKEIDYACMHAIERAFLSGPVGAERDGRRIRVYPPGANSDRRVWEARQRNGQEERTGR